MFEQIAVATKKAAESQHFTSSDGNDTSTMEFWLRSYVSHVRSRHAAHASQQGGKSFVDTLMPHVRLYIKFVLKCMLQSPCFGVVKHFKPHFEAIGSFCPELLPPLAHAITGLAELDLDGDKEVGLDTLQVELPQRLAFSQSALYKDFMAARFSAKLARAKVEKEDGKRAELVKDLLSQAKTSLFTTADSDLEELEFANAMMGALAEGEKMIYLLQVPSRFDFLEVWCPEHEFAVLKPWVTPGAAFKEHPGQSSC